MKFIHWLDKHLEEILMIFLLATITLVMLLQIAMRYFFNNSLAWPEELCRYCFIWFMFMGFSYSTKEDTNLRVDAVVNALPLKLRNRVNLIGTIFGLAFTAFMFISSFETVSNAYIMQEHSVALKVPIYLIHSSALVGFGLATIRYCQHLIPFFAKRDTHKQEA